MARLNKMGKIEGLETKGEGEFREGSTKFQNPGQATLRDVVISTDNESLNAINHSLESNDDRVGKVAAIIQSLWPALEPVSQNEVLRNITLWKRMQLSAPHRHKSPAWWEVLQSFSKQTRFQFAGRTSFDEVAPFFHLEVWERLFLFGVQNQVLSRSQWMQVPRIREWIFEIETDWENGYSNGSEKLLSNTEVLALSKKLNGIRLQISHWYGIVYAKNIFLEVDRSLDQLVKRQFLGQISNATSCISDLKLLEVIEGWEKWENQESWVHLLHLQKCQSCLGRMRSLRLAVAQVQEILP